jgi:hypothetical protein
MVRDILGMMDYKIIVGTKETVETQVNEALQRGASLIGGVTESGGLFTQAVAYEDNGTDISPIMAEIENYISGIEENIKRSDDDKV